MSWKYFMGALQVIAQPTTPEAKLSPRDKIVLERIAWHANQEGISWVGEIRLMAECGMRNEGTIRPKCQSKP